MELLHEVVRGLAGDVLVRATSSSSGLDVSVSVMRGPDVGTFHVETEADLAAVLDVVGEAVAARPSNVIPFPARPRRAPGVPPPEPPAAPRPRTFVGAKYKPRTDVKDIAAGIRADIQRAITTRDLPPIKTRVTISRYSMGQSITVRVTDPGGVLVVNPWRIAHDLSGQGFTGPMIPLWSDAGMALLAKLEGIVKAYQRDSSDPQSDSFNVNFYEDVKFDDFTQAQREAVERQIRAGVAPEDVTLAMPADATRERPVARVVVRADVVTVSVPGPDRTRGSAAAADKAQRAALGAAEAARIVSQRSSLEFLPKFTPYDVRWAGGLWSVAVKVATFSSYRGVQREDAEKLQGAVAEAAVVALARAGYHADVTRETR